MRETEKSLQGLLVYRSEPHTVPCCLGDVVSLYTVVSILIYRVGQAKIHSESFSSQRVLLVRALLVHFIVYFYMRTDGACVFASHHIFRFIEVLTINCDYDSIVASPARIWLSINVFG
jgi:hypothetical protein